MIQQAPKEHAISEAQENEPLFEYVPKTCCSPGRKAYSYMVLISICLLTLGSYFAYDGRNDCEL